jgi:glycosyltransferase involved in cell wall biosynthesis
MDVQLALKSIGSLRLKPNVVHVHAQEGVPIAKVLSSLTHCPLVLDIQGSTADEIARGGLVKSAGLAHQLLMHFEQLVNDMATLLISSSPIMSETLINNFGVPKEKIVTVLDAVDTTIFRPLGKQAGPVRKLRRKLAIPENSRIAIYVGSFSNLQGTDILIRSVPQVLRSNQNVTFLLVGGKWNASYYRYVKSLAEKLNIGKHVVFVPSVDYFDELPCYLSLADVALAPKMHSLQSHGKLPVYMAFGLPTVVFDIPINRMFLNGLGIYATEISPLSLAQAVILALDDCAENPKFSLKIRERATTLFSLERLADDLEKAYRLADSAA